MMQGGNQFNAKAEPFALSEVEGPSFFVLRVCRPQEEPCFDKLSTNGTKGDAELTQSAVHGFMPLLLALLLLAAPALAEAPGQRRTAPEPSDVALFVVAVGAVWLTRRALRRRVLPKD